MPIYEHDTETATYDAPALAYPQISGITVPANLPPDVANANIVIPLLITTYSGPTRAPSVNQVPLLPLIDPKSNLAYGGNTLSLGVNQLAKIKMEGTIDTPGVETTVAGEPRKLNISSITAGTTKLTYGDLIALCLEGRVSATYSRYDPIWFRDPFGRYYNNPRILDYQANYVEAVPNRTTFSITLLV